MVKELQRRGMIYGWFLGGFLGLHSRCICKLGLWKATTVRPFGRSAIGLLLPHRRGLCRQTGAGAGLPALGCSTLRKKFLQRC